MSQGFPAIRSSLNRVSSDLKKGQLITAVGSVREAARLFGRVPMLKNEHEEFVSLLLSTTDLLRHNKDVLRLFPLTIQYTPGDEKGLLEVLSQLAEVLETTSMEEAKEKHRVYQEAQLEKGSKELERGEVDEARQTLGQLGQSYSEEAELIINIGEMFMKSGQYEDAIKHLTLAVRLVPEPAHVMNRLGIALRKAKRFEDAEKTYMQAIEKNNADPNLFFNLARVYLDWEQWEKAKKAALQSLALKPDFKEAGKLASYAEGKLQA